MFFFGDYQGLREKTGSATLTTVPTEKALTTCTSGGPCDLSDYLQGGQGQIYKPNMLADPSNANRTPYPGNIIPASDISPQAVAFFKLIQANAPPNVGGSAITNNFATSGSGIFNTNQWDARVDGRFGDKLHLFGRYTYFGVALSGNPYFGAAGGLGYGAGGFAGTDSARYQSIASGGDYVVSSSWLTDFRFGYYRIYNNTVGPNSNQPLGNASGNPECQRRQLVAEWGPAAIQHRHSQQREQRRPECRIRNLRKPDSAADEPMAVREQLVTSVRKSQHQVRRRLSLRQKSHGFDCQQRPSFWYVLLCGATHFRAGLLRCRLCYFSPRRYHDLLAHADTEYRCSNPAESLLHVCPGSVARQPLRSQSITVSDGSVHTGICDCQRRRRTA